jgi:hypothetical protein
VTSWGTRSRSLLSYRARASRPVTGGADLGDPLDEAVGIIEVVLLVHETPSVPRQELRFVERGEVTHGVVADEPLAPEVEEHRVIRVCVAGTDRRVRGEA